MLDLPRYFITGHAGWVRFGRFKQVMAAVLVFPDRAITEETVTHGITPVRAAEVAAQVAVAVRLEALAPDQLG